MRSTPATIDKDALQRLLQGPDADRRQLRVPRRRVSSASRTRVDGIINYESVLMELNARRPAARTADDHLSEGRDRHRRLPVHAAERRQARRVRQGGGLPARCPTTQRRIMSETPRRPAVPGVALDSRFPTTHPGRAAVSVPVSRRSTRSSRPTSTRFAGRRRRSSCSTCRARCRATGSNRSRRP